MIRPDSTSKVFVIDTLAGEAIGECGCRNFDWVSRNAELIITIGDERFWAKATAPMRSHSFWRSRSTASTSTA